MTEFKTNYDAYRANREAFQRIFDTPKLNRMIDDVTEAETLKGRAIYNYHKASISPKNEFDILVAQKEYLLADKKLEKAAEKYNKFLGHQYEAQVKFAELNGVKPF